MKEFLWLIDGVEKGAVLDLGPVWQSTISFFTEKGFKVSAHDLLRSWREFLREEEERLRRAPVGEKSEPLDRSVLAERFAQANLNYPPGSYHGVFLWDALDYLDAEVLPRLAPAIHDLLRPGGVVLALFHSKPPAVFHRYRLLDGQNLELVPAAPIGPAQRTLQNSEIMKLFSRFRSPKTFVGRDQLREVIFLK